MRKFYILVIPLLLITIFTQLPLSYAQEATAEANLQDKLDELKSSIASKAAQLKSEVNDKLQNKFVYGYINTKQSSQLTLNPIASESTGSKNVIMNEYTILSDQIPTQPKVKRTRKTTVKDLATNEYIFALGDKDDKGILMAKKVILVNPITPTKKKVLWGKIESIVDKVLKLKTNDQTIELTISPSTQISEEKQEKSLTDLKPGTTIIVGVTEQDTKQTPNFIYLPKK